MYGAFSKGLKRGKINEGDAATFLVTRAVELTMCMNLQAE
jgi:hypothetical protein